MTYTRPQKRKECDSRESHHTMPRAAWQLGYVIVRGMVNLYRLRTPAFAHPVSLRNSLRVDTPNVEDTKRHVLLTVTFSHPSHFCFCDLALGSSEQKVGPGRRPRVERTPHQAPLSTVHPHPFPSTPPMRLLRSLPRKKPQVATSATQLVPASSPSPPANSPPQRSQRFFEKRIGKEATDDTIAVVLGIIHTVATAASNVDISIPGLKIGLLALVAVIEKIQVRDYGVS